MALSTFLDLLSNHSDSKSDNEDEEEDENEDGGDIQKSFDKLFMETVEFEKTNTRLNKENKELS